MELLKKYISKNKLAYIGSVLLALLSVIAGLASYIVLGQVVLKLLEGQGNISFYSKNVLYIFLLMAVKELLLGISTSISHTASYGLIRDIRQDIVDKLYLMPLGDILNHSTGKLKDIIVSQVDNMETTLAHIIPELTANLIGPLVLIYYMFRIDWRMTLLSFIPLVIGIIFMSGPMKRAPERSAGAVKIGQAMNNAIVEYIDGIEVIKTFNQGEKSYKKFTDSVRNKAHYYYSWMSENTGDYAVSMTIAPLGILTIIPCGLYFCMNGSLKGSSLILLIILSFGTVKNIMSSLSYSDDLARISTTLDEIENILNARELKNTEGNLQPQDYSVDIENVNFSYEDGKKVIDNLSLRIDDGSVCALVGPSGSGKSTMAKLMAGFWNVDSGQITIGGVNIDAMSLDHLSSLISYVSQDNFLFDLSVRDNIRVGKKGASDAEVERIAKESGCHDFIMNLSEGYDTLVGEAGARLSGGERQRISLARAMLKDAPIILLDEATSYIDPENEALIQAAISSLVKGKTLIIVAHRLRTITGVDKIFVLDQGKLIDSGSHEELLEQSPFYKEMFEASIRGEEE